MIEREFLAYAIIERATRANNRETVAGWILNSPVGSAAVLPPFEAIFMISACC